MREWRSAANDACIICPCAGAASILLSQHLQLHEPASERLQPDLTLAGSKIAGSETAVAANPFLLPRTSVLGVAVHARECRL